MYYHESNDYNNNYYYYNKKNGNGNVNINVNINTGRLIIKKNKKRRILYSWFVVIIISIIMLLTIFSFFYFFFFSYSLLKNDNYSSSFRMIKKSMNNQQQQSFIDNEKLNNINISSILSQQPNNISININININNNNNNDDMMNINIDNNSINNCIWDNKSIYYSLNTSSHIIYSGDHWFHIAENFFVQYLKIKDLYPYDNNNQIIFNEIDMYFNLIHNNKMNFINELNSMTRFFIIMGFIPSSSSSSSLQMKNVHFLSSSFHEQKENEKGLRIGDKFLLSLTSRTNNKIHNDNNKCVKYMGIYGGDSPCIQRGKWFPNGKLDRERFHQKINLLCSSDGIMSTSTSTIISYNNFQKETNKRMKMKYKMVIYQRDKTRKLENINEIIDMFKKNSNNFNNNYWEIKVIIHNDLISPCYLYEELQETNILLTSHGFQSLLLTFLPQKRKALFIEIFPYRYYKNGYQKLCNEMNIQYKSIHSKPVKWLHYLISIFILNPFVSTDLCMSFFWCRSFVRYDNVYVTYEDLKNSNVFKY